MSTPTFSISDNPRLMILLLIFLAVSLRGITLEIPNLVEPTEGRYAAMAHQIIESGNWLMPQFPRGNNYEPYLGKPPLFFWLTAFSYESFGVEEWSGRLPSFLAYVLVAFAIAMGGFVLKQKEVFLVAALMWVTSLAPFFFSGAIVLDVLLTLFITISLLSFIIIQQRAELWRLSYVFWISAALGFLVKGPVALFLIGAPIAGFILATKSWKTAQRILISPGSLLFFALIVPWFLMAEKEYPGLLEYFFINENFLRYFVKNYGDKYGSGHTYPYGMAILFFLAAFIPWSFWLLGCVTRRVFYSDSLKNPIVLFAGTTTLITLIFFCGMKQLHIGYVIPIVPWAAVVVASAVPKRKAVYVVATVTSIAFSAFLFFITPFVNEGFSSTRIIACIARHRLASDEPVAVVGLKSYSARLFRTDWKEELRFSVPLSFFSQAEDLTGYPRDIMVAAKRSKDLNLVGYTKITTLGPWEWWQFGTEVIPVICQLDDSV